MKKTYTVEYGPTGWECTIEIDETPNTLECIKIMVEFWTDWEHRLFINDDDYVKTFLQQLAREINYIQAEYNYNLIGVKGEFENREGWSKMDGSYGIEIMEIDDFEFSHSEYVVMPVEAVQP